MLEVTKENFDSDTGNKVQTIQECVTRGRYFPSGLYRKSPLKGAPFSGWSFIKGYAGISREG